MNAIKQLESSIVESVPGVWTRLRRPRDPNGTWWLDARIDDHDVTVEWSVRRGFGVSASALGDGYGEGPEETFETVQEATARVLRLLRDRGHTAPPLEVALRELRAMVGSTQEEVAARMGIGQGAVSRLERRDEMTLSTLRRYVEALGGRLDLSVTTPAGERVLLCAPTGSGKPRSLLCVHREREIAADLCGDVEEQVEGVHERLQSVLRVAGSTWALPPVSLVVAGDVGSAPACDAASRTVRIDATWCARWVRRVTQRVGARADAGPDAGGVQQAWRHLLAHEVGHLVPAEQVRSRFPDWVSLHQELRAEAFAGWHSGVVGDDPVLGSALARTLGCEAVGCTHPSPAERALAYLTGHLAGREATRRASALGLLVVRCRDVERSLSFYTAIGLSFVREQHGRGPVHHAATLDGGTVLELYPCGEKVSVGGLRMGIRVADPLAAVRALQRLGWEARPAASRSWIVEDPDGLTVDLMPIGV